MSGHVSSPRVRRTRIWQWIVRNYRPICVVIVLLAIVAPLSRYAYLLTQGPAQIEGVNDRPSDSYYYAGAQYFNNVHELLGAIARYHLITDPDSRASEKAKIVELRDALHRQAAQLAHSPDTDPKLRQVPGYARAYAAFRDLDEQLDALVDAALGSVNGVNRLFARLSLVREAGVAFLYGVRGAELAAFDRALADRLRRQRREVELTLLFVAGVGVLALLFAWALKLVDAARQREQDAAAQARRNSEARTALLGMVSHELRTPLQVLLAKLELLSLHDLDPRSGRIVDELYEGVELMGGKLDNISLYTRLASGKAAAKSEEFDLRELLMGIARNCGARAQFEEQHIQVRIDEGLQRIKSDPVRLAQIVENFLENAIKYARPSPIVLSAARLSHEFRPGRPAPALQICVEDRGAGIAPEDLKRIWEPFVRANRETSSAKGSGLGLAVANMLASAAGWEVGVHSEPDKGSKFYVLVPLERRLDSPAGRIMERVRGRRASDRAG